MNAAHFLAGVFVAAGARVVLLAERARSYFAWRSARRRKRDALRRAGETLRRWN